MSPAGLKYASEIAQMMSVLGAQPHENSVRYTEEIVRTQIQDQVALARDIAARRGSRVLQTEDLLFLHRHDKCRSARLRAFLGWRDTTRRHYGVDVDDAEGFDEIISDALAVQRQPVRARWDVISSFSTGFVDETEENLEDQRDVYKADAARLHGDDQLTRSLSIEDYRQYAEAREASFTWRKNKRFRDFINLSANNVDTPALDEITDVLGFLAFEVVRTICERGLSFAAPVQAVQEMKRDLSTAPPLKRARTTTADEGDSLAKTEGETKRPRINTNTSVTSIGSPPLESAFATPSTLTGNTAIPLPDGPFATRQPSPPPQEVVSSSSPSIILPKALPLSREPLLPSQVDEAYLELHERQCRPKGEGLRNFRRGWSMRRTTLT